MGSAHARLPREAARCSQLVAVRVVSACPLKRSLPLTQMRFGAQTRLNRSREIREMFGGGTRINCGAYQLILKYRPTDSVNSSRCCVIASRKLSNKAVNRNLAKRRLRELFRKNFGLLEKSTDVILIARRSLLDTPFNILEKRYQKALYQWNQSPSA